MAEEDRATERKVISVGIDAFNSMEKIRDFLQKKSETRVTMRHVCDYLVERNTKLNRMLKENKNR